MSQFVIHQARHITSQRTLLFWMERAPREMRCFPFRGAIRQAYDQLDQTLRDIDDGDSSLVTKINQTLVTLNEANQALTWIRDAERERRYRSLYDPLVRYNLVHERHGRDSGVGRIANRWIECALDACRLTLPSDDGIVQHDMLAPILNSASGVETYRRTFGHTGMDDIELEYEMVSELLYEVPPTFIKEASSRFLLHFERGEINAIADWLRDDVTEFSLNSEWLDQFRDLTLLNADRVSTSGVGKAFRTKLRQLAARARANAR